MSIQFIQTVDAHAIPWKNGGGITRELLTWPPLSGDDWSMRVSVATIDREGPFSAFSGIQRWFAVLDGAGVQLHFGPASQKMVPGDAPLFFQGKDAPGCQLIDGSTQDLNLMSRGGSSTMKLIANGDAFVAGTGVSAMYCVVPGIFSDNQGNHLAMKAHTLLWDDDCKPGVNWHFVPADEDAPVRGFWLSYKPKEVA